jgi:hypothetical protein
MTSPWVDGEELTAEIMYERVTAPLNAVGDDTDWISNPHTLGILSNLNGATITSSRIRRIGSLVYIYAVVTMPAITVGPTGNITNIDLVSIDNASYQPASTAAPQSVPSGATGPIALWAVTVAGTVALCAVSAGSASISAGDSYSFSGSYMVGG